MALNLACTAKNEYLHLYFWLVFQYKYLNVWAHKLNSLWPVSQKTRLLMWYFLCVFWFKNLYICSGKYTVVTIWSGSKPFIKVVLKSKCVLVLGQLWWTFLIHFKCWLLYLLLQIGTVIRRYSKSCFRIVVQIYINANLLEVIFTNCGMLMNTHCVLNRHICITYVLHMYYSKLFHRYWYHK